jgi:hypothetical protein
MHIVIIVFHPLAQNTMVILQLEITLRENIHILL